MSLMLSSLYFNVTSKLHRLYITFTSKEIYSCMYACMHEYFLVCINAYKYLYKYMSIHIYRQREGEAYFLTWLAHDARAYALGRGVGHEVRFRALNGHFRPRENDRWAALDPVVLSSLF